MPCRANDLQRCRLCGLSRSLFNATGPSRVQLFVNKILIAAAFTLALGGSPLDADDWSAPQRMEVFSENGLRFVRVLPGESIGETVGFSGGKTGRHATAEFYQREPDRSYRLVAEADLANPVAPVSVMLSNSGALSSSTVGRGVSSAGRCQPS